MGYIEKCSVDDQIRYPNRFLIANVYVALIVTHVSKLCAEFNIQWYQLIVSVLISLWGKKHFLCLPSLTSSPFGTKVHRHIEHWTVKYCQGKFIEVLKYLTKDQLEQDLYIWRKEVGKYVVE